MNEAFLHYLWQYQKFDRRSLTTREGEPVEIIRQGLPNHGSGPDFTDARIRIGERLWAGNVEIHVKSSDWFAHHHETDPAYDTVILHVVHWHDMPVFNTRGVPIPVLELKDRIPENLFLNYRRLQTSGHPLRCHGRLEALDALKRTHWLERLYVERLAEKTAYFDRLLEQNLQDWEGVLFVMLLRYFGMPANSDAFERIGRALPFGIFKRYTHDPLRTEALLMGMAGLLRDEPADAYMKRLQDEFRFLQAKHKLQPPAVRLQFGRMRPANFPTVRLAQLARLYHRENQLFARLIHRADPAQWQKILRTGTSPYWRSHYRFGRSSRERNKFTGRLFIRNLMVNVLIPVRFAYENAYGTPDTERILDLARRLPPEDNYITRLFADQGIANENALVSQALIRLKKQYCDRDACLRCAWGHEILSSG